MNKMFYFKKNSGKAAIPVFLLAPLLNFHICSAILLNPNSKASPSPENLPFLIPSDFVNAQSVDKHSEPPAIVDVNFGIDDFKLLPEQLKKNVRSFGRAAVTKIYQKWPKSGNSVHIPYVISESYTEEQRSVLASAFLAFHDTSCVEFVPKRSEDEDFLDIAPRAGVRCFSAVGRTGGRQNVSLSASCMRHGTILHELMHTLGFFHEHNRNDRDRYIEVHLENVRRQAKQNFAKFSIEEIDHLGEPYDYGSIMHYGPYTFTKNRKPTIVPRRQINVKMGQRTQLSEIDIRKINKLRLRCDPDPVKATAEPVIKNTKTTAKTMKFVTSTPSETSTGILTSSTKASTGVVTASSSSGLPSGPIWGGIGFLFATLVGVNIGVHSYRKQKVARMLAERRRAAAVRWAREMEVQNANLRPRRPHVAFVPTRPLRAVPISGSVTVDVELDNFSTPPESPK